MPSKSKKQHNYIAMLASQGVGWAKEWLHKDKGKNLPNKKKKNGGKRKRRKNKKSKRTTRKT